MKKFEKITGLVLLVFAIGFNLWLYRLEPTSTIDPNDNTFQFALVDRTNQMVDYANKECSKNILTFPLCHLSILIDHWVPNWAEGYNLPFYYSHIPQIAIVLSWRILSFLFHGLTLFRYYHIVVYLLLCLFPLPVFLALRVVGFSWLTAGFGALLASHISTDGLYGLDPPSFLWRGWGLSSQLFAMVFLPLAIAYSHKVFSQLREPKHETRQPKSFLPSFFPFHPSSFWLAVLFIVATTAGHLGLGMMAMMSLVVFTLADPIIGFLRQESLADIGQLLKKNILLLAALGGASVFFLSYWILPVVLGDNYHNISFWDPVWKFNSYGWKEILNNLFNGNLFDFGRFPVLTILVLTGALVSVWPRENGLKSVRQEIGKKFRITADLSADDNSVNLFPFSLLFTFWLILYFGRTTWGGILDIIPGMKEQHISRFIVGVHAAGLFLVPIAFSWIVQQATPITAFLSRLALDMPIAKVNQIFTIGILTVLVALPAYRQTMRYNELNERLIVQSIRNHDAVREDSEKLFEALRKLPPGRVFPGRGGWWGKDFSVAETPYNMHLSTYGIPVVLWLPETWSPNSDTEQYFSEDVARDYDLYNIRYVAAPPSQKAQLFWKPLAESTTWKLYEVNTSGYFTIGTRAAVVGTNKRSYGNIVRLWIQSPYSEKKLFPELRFIKKAPTDTRLPYIQMVDEATYSIWDKSHHSLFAEVPVYQGNYPLATLAGPQTVVSDMIFKTTVKVEKDCKECILVLKQTYHPNWRATIDGKPVKPITVFPFFVAIPLSTEGTHEVVMWYQPGTLKVVLVLLELAVLICLAGFFFLSKRRGTR